MQMRNSDTSQTYSYSLWLCMESLSPLDFWAPLADATGFYLYECAIENTLLLRYQ
jgi:hypothetical protein